MRVRLADSKDISSSVELGRRMYLESRFSRYPFDPMRVEEMFNAVLKDKKGSCFFVAERDSGQMVGMFIGHASELFFSPVLAAYDKLLYVVPEARGSSAALRLLSLFRHWAQELGVAEISVNMTVAIEMERFQRFMSHLGFRCCGTSYWMPIERGAASLP